MPYGDNTEQKRVQMTIPRLRKMKESHEKIAMLTCYDSTFAQAIDRTGVIHTVLIGDSLGMVLQGHRDTLKVTIDQIAYHVESVARANTKMVVIGDMPFGTFTTSEDAYRNAHRLMEAGAQMVKVEGNRDWLYDIVEYMTLREIPVCAHIGLTPQSVHRFGGWKIQGKERHDAEGLMLAASSLENAGASMIVLELMPEELGQTITESVKIPTIGIGAGRHTDGQVLVLHDMLGLNTRAAKFVRNFMVDPSSISIEDAILLYGESVRDGRFPGPEHVYHSEALQ